MRQYITIKQKIAVIDEVYCNKCSNCITESDHVHIDHTWGFHSNQDGTRYELDLCESCFKGIIKRFKIKPKVTLTNG